VNNIAVCIARNRTGRTRLYIDVLNFEDIRRYISGSGKVRDEFRDIWGIIKEDLRIPEKYNKVNARIKGKDFYEMIFKSNGRDDRILCVEMKDRNSRKIIMIKLFERMSAKSFPESAVVEIDKKGGFDYELEE
jgi:hypothetical protein